MNYNKILINALRRFQHFRQLCSEKGEHQRTLQFENMNENIIKLKYAVRGPLVIRANKIAEELKKRRSKPFKSMTMANIGDCHAMGQIPLTFIREVLALAVLPRLMEDGDFKEDVKERAKMLLAACGGGSVGAYSASAGIEIIRRHVAEFIECRDGIKSDWKNIYLGGGASESIRSVLKLMIREINGQKPGVMIPIPQYPLYSATLAEFDMHPIEYYLDESKNWSLNIDELERSITEAKVDCFPRAIVVINPGNPTGQVLSQENIQQIIEFALQHKLFILADEVYQHNIYAEGSAFHSFKKTMHCMGEPYKQMELASFMSVSKGYMGECGLRGGYVETVNMCPKVKAMFEKAGTAKLCSTVLGQIVVDCVTNPPKDGDPSYEQFTKEKKAVLRSLKLRAKMVTESFNGMEGFSCNEIMGAMYAFPQFKLPAAAIQAAKKAKLQPDEFYAFELLESTGICIIPGSGFGQKEGTYHFRTTILPQKDQLEIMLKTFAEYHKKFIAKYK